MGRVSKNNYLHLLRETIDVLSQVQVILGKEDKNSAHIDDAIRSLQNVVRYSGMRSARNASEAYRKKVEEEVKRRKWREQQRLEQQIQQQEQSTNEESSQV